MLLSSRPSYASHLYRFFQVVEPFINQNNSQLVTAPALQKTLCF